MTKCWGAGECPNRICMNCIRMHTSLLTYIPKPKRKDVQIISQPQKQNKTNRNAYNSIRVHYLIIESEDPDKQYLQL